MSLESYSIKKGLQNDIQGDFPNDVIDMYRL